MTVLKQARQKIKVIGLGVADTAHFDPLALTAFNRADVVIGSARQLAVVKPMLTAQQRTIELVPLKQFRALLDELQHQAVVVLASGDPLYYGIGRWLLKQFDKAQLQFFPAVSSVQATCHALGLALQDVDVLSLHGRPLSNVRRRLKKGRTLLVLTDKNSQPQHLAQQCLNANFAQSGVWVCERLGYANQTIRQFDVSTLLQDTSLIFDPLHVTVIKLEGPGGVLPQFPGIDDCLFTTDKGEGKGMLTKRDVRLSILSLLSPSCDDVIWDIGAGCGSVAVELAFWQAQASIYAIEHHPERLKCLSANREQFGVASNLTIVSGHAPEVLNQLPSANKVFIGGSDGNLAQLLEISWQQLDVDGCIVVSAVTEATRHQMFSFCQNLAAQQIQTTQIAVSQGGTLAGQMLYRPNLPVTLYKLTKNVYGGSDELAK